MNNEENKKEIVIKHPKFGHVVFYNPTSRQLDVLRILQKQMESLGAVKQKLFNELVKEKENNNSQS